MPRKTKPTAAADSTAALPQIPPELLDQLVTGPMTAGQVQGLFDQFRKAPIEPAVGAELSHHLGYAPGQPRPEGTANHRNGKSAKTVLTDTGSMRIAVPRDREAASSRRSSTNTSGNSPALTTRSSPCTRAA